MSPGGPSRSPQAGDDQSPWQPFVASSPPCPSCEASSHPWPTFQPWSTVGPSQAPFFWSPGGHFQPRSQPAGADRSPGSPFEMRPTPAGDDRSPGGGGSSQLRRSLADRSPGSPSELRSTPAGYERSPGGSSQPLLSLEDRTGPSPVPSRKHPLDYEPEVVCYCNRKAARFTSWKKFPGRRFYRCDTPVGTTKCRFFQWCDPVFDEHVTGLLVDLVLKVDKLTADLEAFKKKEQDIQSSLADVVRNIRLT